MLAINRRIQKLEQSIFLDSTVHIRINHEEKSFIIPANAANEQDIVYKPYPTTLKFHSSNKIVRLIIGPYGSGKTSSALAEIILRAAEMPRDSQGIRKSRWAIIRNTSGELETTTLKTWLTWFGDLGEVSRTKKPVLTYTHKFRDERGLIELELIFLALDREADLGKVRSLEITGAYINELSEIVKPTLEHLLGRVGRYPKKDYLKESYWHGIICDTNPPSTRHWIYELFEKERPEQFEIFKQPPGLIKDAEDRWQINPNAENIKNLPENYYLNMIPNGEEFVKVFCLGEYGILKSGKVVYPEYNDDLHSVDDIPLVEGAPLYIGVDVGAVNSGAIILQHIDGQIRVIKELLAYDLGIEQFTQDILSPYLSRYAPTCPIEVMRSDPWGKARNPVNAQSCIDVLKVAGFNILPAATNDIETRLNTVKHFLIRLADGKPAIVISRKGCPYLREGFLSEYHYKKINLLGEDKYRDEPYKNHPHSEAHDALQYILMHFININRQDRSDIDISKFMSRGLRF